MLVVPEVAGVVVFETGESVGSEHAPAAAEFDLSGH